MPIKRRTGKAHRLDDFRREQLMDGPDACLIAAVGYLAPYRVAQFADLSADQQAEVRAWRRERGGRDADPWVLPGRKPIEGGKGAKAV